MTTRAQTNSLKPKTLVVSRHPTPVSSVIASEPKPYKQAASSPEWLCAMEAEYQALCRNCTWTLVPCPPTANVVGCKWVYRIKRRADGSIERYKARLVAKGFHQEEGVDFHDTFSPVVKPSTIKLVLSYAVTKGWAFKQLDVNNTFLNGDLTEVVYMSQPPGFIDKSHPHFVCRLSKALYGLKQAPRAWFLKLKTFLLSHGYTCCYSDSSLFVRHTSSSTTYLLVYVDDIIITGSDPSYISSFTQSLDLEFSLKDLGNLSFFLGIEVSRVGSGMHLSQTSYIRDLLTRTKMTDCKPSPSPADTTFQLSKHGETFDDPSLFRSIVDALQYATITRPEISFSVSRVCQYMKNPTLDHWKAVKRILRYLKGSLTHGISITPSTSSSIHVYCNAGWAADPDDRRSHHGFAAYYGPNLISWSSRKQKVVARSSTEAEYRAIAFAASEVSWIARAPPVTFATRRRASSTVRCFTEPK
uniref:Reverse transcriptase Ty1/copia-type domain-containing protein n=1 Tax=Solanum lycopersicum TaxID=4081 RepID=A0A3Q7H262_SOLLC